ncbi:hypothetical protein CISIN_1g039238mg [Citrus sinensis]|uniref:Uncharacterized protein n=1 Tax=Citrus sinensis TaxID=2711 RepID=A0A067DXQ6_CITSI|nr:hypothetical protein CISIN_1g039238mg [Citrus sinensis]
MKRKNEEMKVKLYSLRTQKMELDRRLLEMQSTIDSLKDEQKALESALEEKQNEIKMQREQIDASKENSQLIVLKEILKQREAEIKDLRHQLEYRVNVWSVSADDPSNPRKRINQNHSSSKEAGGRLHDSAKFNDGENSTRIDDRSEKSVGATISREITVEPLEKQGISQDEGFKNGGGIQGKGINEGEGKRKNIGNSTEQIVDDQATVLKPRDDSSEVKGDLQHTITGEWESEKPENSQDEKQEVQTTSKGGMKLEVLDSRTRLKGKHGHVNRTKGRRWRAMAKNRVSENNGASSMSSRRFYRLDQDELRSRSEGQVSTEGLEKREGKETGENPQELSKAMDAKLLKVNPEDAKLMEKRDENADPNQQLQQQNAPDRECLRIKILMIQHLTFQLMQKNGSPMKINNQKKKPTASIKS